MKKIEKINTASSISSEIRDVIVQIFKDIETVDTSLLKEEMANDNIKDADFVVKIFSLLKGNKEIIKDIEQNISKLNLSRTIFSNVQLVNAYINFQLDSRKIVSSNYSINFEDKSDLTYVVDYCGYNIAKPLSVGHLRPSLQGQYYINLLKKFNVNTIGDNHLGDWGTPIGMIIYMLKQDYDEVELLKSGVSYISSLYIEFNELLEKDKEKYMEIANKELGLLESGDNESVKLYHLIVDYSLDHINKMTKLIGVTPDNNIGEYFHIDRSKKIVDELIKSGVATDSKGAVIIDLEDSDISTPMIIRKSNGQVLYSTTDLATLEYRSLEYNPDKIVYFVGNEQQLHFKQVFAAARKANLVNENTELLHTPHGIIKQVSENGKIEKMSSRKGVVTLSELIEKIEKIAEKTDKKNARLLAINAIKVNELKGFKKNDVVFDWNSIFDTNGETAIYLNYTFVRALRVIENIPGGSSIAYSDTKCIEVNKLIQLIYKLELAINESFKSTDPGPVSEVMFELCRLYNSYYSMNKIIEENQINGYGLYITEHVIQLLSILFEIYGIKPLRRM